MPTDPTSDTADLRELWSATARGATDAQLVACVVIAFAAAIGFGIGALVSVRRAFQWWPLLLPALLAGTFGVWGIADREMGERSGERWRRALAATKWCSAVAAGIVVALAAIGILKVTIGTWIS